ncbi:MAG: T9SS type A sorting domain-containing protein [Gelidibacter sp.]
MKKIYFLLLILISATSAFSQGNETFDNLGLSGSSYADGTFLGQDGSTWTYTQSRGDLTITDAAIMLGRNRTPQAEVYSGTISGGVGTISFNYMQAFSSNVNLNVLVNDVVVGNVTSSGEQNTVKASGTITVNQPGDVVIKFISVNNSDGQVVIDDVVWTGYSGAATPNLVISSPTDNTVFPSGTTSVDVSIIVQNFVVGNPGTGIDGHIHWTVNTVDQAMKYNVNDETIAVADGQSYTVFMQLVDNSHQPIAPAVNATVNFSVAYPCDLQIGTINTTCDAITSGVDTYTTTLDFTGGGTSTYTIDTGGIGTISGDDPSAMASGTVTITGVNEGTDFVVTFTGNPANSGCDISRNISSPNCNPTTPLPIYENFNYGSSAGDLTAVSGGNWVNHSGSTPIGYATTSLSMPGYASSGLGGSATITGSNSEDANRPFTPQTTGTIYMSALVNISAVGSGNYFLHLLKDDGSNFRARVGAKDDGSGNILFGIGTTASTLVYGTTPFNLNTTYLLVASFNIDSGLTNLYVLTSPVATEPSTPEATETGGGGTVISAVALRQSSNIPTAVIDGINVATNWAAVTLSTGNFSINNFKVYPNPTSTGFVNISSSNSENISVAVFDILGKQVINKTISNNRLNVSALNSGIYIMKISQNNATVTKKLVIK